MEDEEAWHFTPRRVGRSHLAAAVLAERFGGGAIPVLLVILAGWNFGLRSEDERT